MAAARRLQLAAETGGVTGILLCGVTGGRHGVNAPGAMAPDFEIDQAGAGSTQVGHTPDFLPPSPAVSRWHADHAPGGGGMRWRLALRRCRDGGSGQWMVDWDEKTHCLAVAAAAGD
jgi:hypothetical protein